MEMNERYYMGRISPSDILTDTSYQHPVNQKRVDKIAQNWDELLVNPPKVSHREDGKFYVFDGQHTIISWQIVHGNEPIMCRIYEGLTREDEKNLFVQQNGFSSQPTKIEKLRAEFNLGNKEVVDMVESAKLLGYTVVFNQKSNYPNSIAAVATLFNTYKMLGKDNYINVLTVMRNAWGSDKNATDGGIIKGIAFIYKYYSDNITNSKMIDALRKQTPDYYLREAKELSGSLEKRMAKVMIKIYNSGKRTNRLPEF